jgi:hypothetical protein
LIIEGSNVQMPQPEQTIINRPSYILLTSIELGTLHLGHL